MFSTYVPENLSHFYPCNIVDFLLADFSNFYRVYRRETMKLLRFGNEMPQIYSAGYRASKQLRREPRLLSDIGDPAVGIMSIKHPNVNGLKQWLIQVGWVQSFLKRGTHSIHYFLFLHVNFPVHMKF